MKRYLIFGVIVPLLLPGMLSVATAADQDQLQTRDQTPDRDRDQLQTQDRDQIYGSQLMTPGERAQYHTRMRNLKTERERERYRLEHHRQMQERARERGVTLSDQPMLRGGGMGPGGRQ